MRVLSRKPDRKPFKLHDITATGLHLFSPDEVELAMVDSFRRGENDINPMLVKKAKTSVPDLFSNWQRFWPNTYNSWARSELRLVVGRRIDRDLVSGKDRIHQYWFIFSEDDYLIARVSARDGSYNLDSRPSDQLSIVARDLSAELAEPSRYFVSIDCPSDVKRSWAAPLFKLDAPCAGDSFESAVKQFSGKSLLVDPVLDHIGSDDVRCYMTTSAGDFVLYKEGIINAELYVTNIKDFNKIITLADPVKELDEYMGEVIKQAIDYKG